MQCAILAGGLATRMRPRTETVPKALLPVNGRPFADIQLAWLAEQGVSNVVLCVAYLGEQIREYVGDGARWGLDIAYVDEGDRLLGTAGALRLAYEREALDPAFLVLYGDSYLTCELAPVWREFERRRPAALMTVYRNEGRYDRSNARLSGGSVVYDKRVADPASVGMHHIDYGLSILDRDQVIAPLPAGEVVDLADVYTELGAVGRLAGYEVTDRFYEIGSPAGLAELEDLLA